MTTRSANRVLIANRGEIALRVVRTVRDLGGTSILPYTPEDLLSPAAELADEAHALSRIDEDHQAEAWGRDDEAEAVETDDEESPAKTDDAQTEVMIGLANDIKAAGPAPAPPAPPAPARRSASPARPRRNTTKKPARQRA